MSQQGYRSQLPVVQTATGTTAALGDTPVIASPGVGLRLALLSVSIRNNNGANNLVTLKETASGLVLDTTPTTAVGSGNTSTYPFPAMKTLAFNQGLTINLSAANSIAYTVDYTVISY